MPYRQKSMKSYLFRRMVLVVLIILILLGGSNLYAVGLVRDQVGSASRITVDLHVALIEKELTNVELYMSGMLAGNADLGLLAGNTAGDARHFARVRFLATAGKDALNYKPVGNFFLFDLVDERYYAIEQGSVNFHLSKEQKKFLQYSEYSTQWNILQVAEDFYLYRFFSSGNIYMGVWVKAETMLDVVAADRFSEETSSLLLFGGDKALTGRSFVADNHIELQAGGEEYYLTGSPDRYLAVSQASQKGDFQFVMLVPDRIILAEFPRILVLTFLFTVVLVLLTYYIIAVFQRSMMRPMTQLVKAMGRIRQGDIGARIDVHAKFSEFNMVQDQFNDMSQEIQRLKINIYEEQLALQKAELEHVQLQVNPHFFLNSLNIIYGFSQTKNYRLIQELTLSLVGYFRYVFDAGSAVMPLERELEHIANYMQIQKLRFPGQLQYEIHREPFLGSCLIPTLLIHTFIENAVKYAAGYREELLITAQITRIENKAVPEAPFLQVVIRDNGPGFSEEMLERIKNREQIVDERGRHIGIWNAQRRLSLLYQENGSVQVVNHEDGGGMVTVILPYRTKWEG